MSVNYLETIGIEPTGPDDARAARVARWEHYTEAPLTAAALLFLFAYAVRIISPTQTIIPSGLDTDLLTITWIAFGVDYAVRLALSPDRWEFFKRNILDLLSIILPMARPLRLLRAFAALSILNRFGIQTLHGRLVTYIVGGSALILFVAGLAVTDAERGLPGSTINSFGNGLWWAVVTMSTVGYGDMTPVSTLGRIIGVGLMVAGIILPAVIAGTISSYIISRVGSEKDVLAETPPQYIESLINDIERLRVELEQTRSTVSATGLGQPIPVTPIINPAGSASDL